MKKIKKQKLPEFFEKLFWGYEFPGIDPEKNETEIVVQTINYGDWEHWRWITNYYGKRRLKKIIKNIPASAFRKSVLELAKTLFKIKSLNYESRSDSIRKSRNF